MELPPHEQAPELTDEMAIEIFNDRLIYWYWDDHVGSSGEESIYDVEIESMKVTEKDQDYWDMIDYVFEGKASWNYEDRADTYDYTDENGNTFETYDVTNEKVKIRACVTLSWNGEEWEFDYMEEFDYDVILAMASPVLEPNL